jgi:rod shape determining protein RodA
MFERRLYQHLDWVLLAAVLAITAIGVVMVYATTGGASTAANRQLVMTQLYAIALGLIAVFMVLLIDYQTLADVSHVVYFMTAAALVFVLVFGAARGGARRWIALPYFNLQPSEFAKLALALVLAKYFAEVQRARPDGKDLLIGGALTLGLIVLIALEPDLGTAVTLAAIFLALAFVSGMRLRGVAIILALAVVTAPIAWRYVLKDYQKARIAVFLDPEQDPRGAGYQQLQARVTVGSGGVWGKGFMKGTQGQLRFLPEAHNDFMFSVLAEEHGLMGVLVALGLYLAVMLRSIKAARLAKDRLGAYLVVGILAGFGFQVFYNITMSAGLAPVKGLTLPLMSYGGSAMIATLAGFGLILNVRMRRFTN